LAKSPGKGRGIWQSGRRNPVPLSSWVVNPQDPVAKFLRRKYPYAGQALEDRLLDRAMMRERWTCSLETLRRFERAGILRPIKLGAKVRYRLSDVLIAEREGEVVA
jgi:hypothetical protein